MKEADDGVAEGIEDGETGGEVIQLLCQWSISGVKYRRPYPSIGINDRPKLVVYFHRVALGNSPQPLKSSCVSVEVEKREQNRSWFLHPR